MKKTILVIIIILSLSYLIFTTDFFPRLVSFQYQVIRDCFIFPRNSVNNSTFEFKFSFNDKSFCIIEAPQDENSASKDLNIYWILPRGFYSVISYFDYVGELFPGKYTLVSVNLINNNHFTLGKSKNNKQYVEERIKMFDRVGVIKLSERIEYTNKNNIPIIEFPYYSVVPVDTVIKETFIIHPSQNASSEVILFKESGSELYREIIESIEIK